MFLKTKFHLLLQRLVKRDKRRAFRIASKDFDAICFERRNFFLQDTDIHGDLDPNMTLLRQKMDGDETRSFSLSLLHGK